MSKIISAIDFKSLLESGANNLTNQYEYIDSLNVFPVPDGDTGTNMHLTLNAGVFDCLNAKSENLGDLAKILSKGLLMGARGNSGVILSQIFRGFAQAVEGKATITIEEFADALINGSLAAYKAVMRPVEGTILTVAKESAKNTKDSLKKNKYQNLSDFLTVLVDFAKVSLENTPNLLPILKEVGVVDSGGAGLLVIYEGFLSASLGTIIELSDNQAVVAGSIEKIAAKEFGYCTEFIVNLSDNFKISENDTEIKEVLGQLGDSIVVVQDEDIVKVHVHTLRPGEVLNKCQKYGDFIKIKIENMQYQHENLSEGATAKRQHQKYALIAVANGDGVIEAFKQLQAKYIVTGGQTMNPATEDFVTMIEEANADNIIILPNNSNIILAANQATTAFTDINIEVLPTNSIPEGLSACIVFDKELEIIENIKNMSEAIARTTSAAVTYAIKNTTINGLKIKANDYMGIVDKEIIVNNKDKIKVTLTVLDKLVNDNTEILTVIIGEDVKEKEVSDVETYIKEKLKVEYELIRGNQAVYSFLFGVE